MYMLANSKYMFLPNDFSNRRTRLRKGDYAAWWVMYENSICYFTHDTETSSVGGMTVKCTMMQIKIYYGRTMNSFAALSNLDPIVTGYTPCSENESDKEQSGCS